MVPSLYFVIPCYYDEDVLPYTVPTVLEQVNGLVEKGAISAQSRVILVNDGSTDRTWELIKRYSLENERLSGVNLERNFGEQNALIAGMSVCEKADCVISIDSDLQDDVSVTEEMLDRFAAGADVVLGVRTDRPEDSVSERFFSGAFYAAMTVFGTGLVRGHSNFRLLSRRAVDMLLSQKDRSYFLPARVCSLGLPTATVKYIRIARKAGVSGYSFKRKLRLGTDALLLHSRILRPLLRASGAVERNAVRYEIIEYAGF